MKLSIKKRFGWIQVRGGRILDVAHDHQVTTGTQNSLGEGENKWAKPFKDKWVTARVGDLAVEIVAVKTNKVIGYSYLSGDAIQLNLYRSDAPEHWFTPVVGWRVDLTPKEGHTPNHLIAAIMQCKYAPARLVATHIKAEDRATGMFVSNFFQESYKLAPGRMSDQELGKPRSHLLAHIDAASDRDFHVMLHFQPPDEAGEYAAAGFTVELVLMSRELVTKDPFTNISNLTLSDKARACSETAPS